MKFYKAYFDASCDSQKSQTASIGYIIKSQSNILCSISKKINYVDSLTAEYMALYELLQKIIELRMPNVVIYTDCRSIVEQIEGKSRVNDKIEPLFNKIKDIIDSHTYIRLKWISRDNNKHADLISKKARVLNQEDNFINSNKINIIKKYRNISYMKGRGLVILRCPTCKEYKAYSEFPQRGSKKVKHRECFHCISKKVNFI